MAEKNLYKAMMVKANLIVEDTSDGKTKVAIFDEINSIVKDSYKIFDGLRSIVFERGGIEDSPDADQEQGRNTSAIKLEDDFLNSIITLKKVIPELEKLLKMNGRLHEGLVEIFNYRTTKIAAPLSQVTYAEVVGIAIANGKHPDDNIDFGEVQQTAIYLYSSIDKINQTADKMKKAFDQIHDTDSLTAATFLKNLLESKKNKKDKVSGVYSGDGTYGGNQESPYWTYMNGTEEEKKQIRDLIHQHYPNMTENEIIVFLLRLYNEGCGYVACINSFLNNYDGTEAEFEATFGFPMYKIVNGEKVLNYDLMIIDFYASQDNHNLEGGIFGIGGKDKIDKNEDPKIMNPDILDPKKTNPNDIDPEDVGGLGTDSDSREYRFENYMEDHNIKVNVKNGEALGGLVGVENIDASIENYDKYHNQGDIIVSISPVVLEDANGNKWTYGDANSGHAVTVTGKTDDGRLIVSSWGQEWYLNPDTYYQNGRATFQIIEYE